MRAILLLCLMPFAAGGQTIPAYHAIVTSTRTYMDASRTTRSDYWFTAVCSRIYNSRTVTIERSDRGVIYTVMLRAKKYYVDTINPVKVQKEDTSEPDFRYLGQDYEPVFDWVQRSEPGKDSAGLKTEHFTALGEADFDHAELNLWLRKCADRELASWLNRILSHSLCYKESRKPVADRLRSETSRVPYRMEETLRNSIAPPEHYVISIRLAGKENVPDSLFEIPAGVTKDF